MDNKLSSSQKALFDFSEKEENSSGYINEKILDIRKIRKTDFTLRKNQNFDISYIENIFKYFSRKNLIKYGFIHCEEPILVQDTSGNIIIPVLNKEKLLSAIRTFPKNEQRKLGYIHVSTVQIILKSTFSKGIDTPITLEIRDDRIIDRQESIIAIGTGNLAAEVVKFDMNIQLSMSLLDKDLDRSITVRYALGRSNFMKTGNHIFSVSYKINYALTNSHHSLSFKEKDRISVEDLFKSVIEFKIPKRTFDLSNSRRSFQLRDDRSPPIERTSFLKIENDISPLLVRSDSFSIEKPQNFVPTQDKKQIKELNKNLRSIAFKNA